MGHSGSKYLRFVRPVPNGRCQIDTKAGRLAVEADVYQVIEAFGITNPAQAHALKKVLCAGGRGKGSYEQDVREAVDALTRAVQIEADREADREHEAEEERKKWAKVVEDTRQQVREAVDSLTVRPEPADATSGQDEVEGKFKEWFDKQDGILTTMVETVNTDAWRELEKIETGGGDAVAPVLQSQQAAELPSPPSEVAHHDGTRTPGDDHAAVGEQPGRDNAGRRDAAGNYGGRTHRPVGEFSVPRVPGPPLVTTLADVAAAAATDRPKDINDLPPGSPPPWGVPPADRGTAGHRSSASAGH